MPRCDLDDKLKFLKVISSRIKEQFEYDNNEDVVFYAEAIIEKLQEIEESLVEEEDSLFRPEQSYDHNEFKEARHG